MSDFMLKEDELPDGFAYPHAFSRIVGLGLTVLEPWYLLRGDLLTKTMSGLRQRYPDRTLIPFAKRQDNDDLACWEMDRGEEIIIVHDFASPGWEQRDRFVDFWAWFRRAIEDLIEFDP